jgi:hypothetical protein
LQRAWNLNEIGEMRAVGFVQWRGGNAQFLSIDLTLVLNSEQNNESSLTTAAWLMLCWLRQLQGRGHG